MVFVTSIVEQDVDKLIDVDHIQQELSGIPGNAALVFVCVNDDWRKDDAWKKKGTKYYRIVLPYEQVKAMPADKVRALMLRLTNERLGLTEPKLAPALA